MQISYFKHDIFKQHKDIHTAWLILIVATLLGWWLANTGHSANDGMEIATAGIIITAFAKIWIVGFQFMELRSAPRWLRHGFDLWVIVICTILVLICITG